MKKKSRILSFILAFLILLSSPNLVFSKVNDELLELEDYSQALLVANPETDEIYYSKNADKVLGIASMTKMMTYILVKEDLAQGKYKLQDLVKVDAEVAEYAEPGNSRMELAEGEKISVENLLAGLMVVSGNDAAVALAKKSAKTIKAFTERMNAKAKELGLNDAYFINPTGLSEDVTKSGKKLTDFNRMSAMSLYKLAKYLVNNFPEVADYSKLENLSMPKRNFLGDHTHDMYQSIPGLLGLKTGFTLEAMYNFTGYVDMNQFDKGQDYKLITVVTGADTAYVREKATRALIQQVNDNYEYRDLLNYDLQFPVVDFEARDTKEGTFPLYLEKPVRGVYPKGAKPEISYEIFEDKKAPFEDGEALGQVTVSYEGRQLDKINLVNKGYKPRLNFFSRLLASFKDLVRKLMLIF
ncbi:MAG: D-alanyl-D-alanine carboxypeptidase family protein [Tissierellia bacterium]|nr:D-alanyl-D-alanine carboxypeptidase family protein [Tissierellia bacterium]